MKVELLPHIAATHEDGTTTEFAQWALVAAGQHVGWVPKEGTHIAFFAYMPEVDRELVRQEVERLTKTKRIISVPASALKQDEEEETEQNEDESEQE